MKRREFIALLGGAAAAPMLLPLAAHAQQGERMRRIAVLMGYAENDDVSQAYISVFRSALRELGWIEGRNIQIHYGWPATDAGRIRAAAKQLVGLAPDVIMASPGQVALPLKEMTTTVPIVFVNVPDPVQLGLVQSLAHPGGNITGFANFEQALAGKWLEILKTMVPNLTRVGIVYSLENPAWPGRLRLLDTLAPPLGVQLVSVGFREPAEIAPAFEAFARGSIGGVIVLPAIFISVHRATIIAAAERNRLPAVYPFRYYAADGGLMSYGIDPSDMFRRAASYVDRILRGERPSDLPVQQPTKYELVINLKAAKTLGLIVSPTLLALADQVIE